MSLGKQMNVTFTCPHCEKRDRLEMIAPAELNCSYCGKNVGIFDQTELADTLETCLTCGCKELFQRKDFPVRLGLAIVFAGAVISCYTWHHYWPIATFSVLSLSAILDGIVYFLVGDVLICYRCQSEYRGIKTLSESGHFDLEISEKYRQEQIRLKEHLDQS